MQFGAGVKKQEGLKYFSPLFMRNFEMDFDKSMSVLDLDCLQFEEKGKLFSFNADFNNMEFGSLANVSTVYGAPFVATQS